MLNREFGCPFCVEVNKVNIDTATLASQGFLHVPGFLTQAEHLTLVRGCHALITMPTALEVPKVKNFSEKHGSNTHSYLNKFKLVPELLAFSQSTKVKTLRSKVFPTRSVLHMDLLQHSVGGEKQGIAWHRDVLYRYGAMQMVNLLFYPLGTSKELGGVRILPCSQRREYVPELEDSFAIVDGEVCLYPQPTDLLILDGACFHAVSHSRSAQSRMSLNIRVRHQMLSKRSPGTPNLPPGLLTSYPTRVERRCMAGCGRTRTRHPL